MIRLMERLRYKKKHGDESFWSHAFMLVSPCDDNPGDWIIVAAEAHGVEYNHLSMMGVFLFSFLVYFWFPLNVSYQYSILSIFVWFL